jgi:hypothetical protein
VRVDLDVGKVWLEDRGSRALVDREGDGVPLGDEVDELLNQVRIGPGLLVLLYWSPNGPQRPASRSAERSIAAGHHPFPLVGLTGFEPATT